MNKLPIETVLPEIRKSLEQCPNLVLVAPPGAGKTTRVPLALLGEAWLEGKRILMLEPRRLAARAAAGYMATLLGEQVGQTVGYRVRLDARVGPQTRIEVITEGILTRMLQTDPALEGVGAVLFDEFHERSIHADLGLAMALQSQAVLREDLRLVIMSATLTAEPVAALLGGAPVIVSEGRAFPVDTRYIDKPIDGPVEPAVAAKILEALTRDQGDILVFLPGAAEIRRVERRLGEARLGPDIRIATLYGTLPQKAQDAALQPSPAGQRKIVLASTIAETSITVEGVQVVIDSGLMRVPRFSSRTGMARLETVQVSRASADQRRGRAGRLGPGVCYRLWPRQADTRLEPANIPEIMQTDLAALALELAVWGAGDAVDLVWLDPPPAAAYQQARELLEQLGALDANGAITAHGRGMAATGLHPRLAHMIIVAMPLGLGELACELAALLSERDLLRSGGGPADADLRLRVEALRRFGQGRRNGYLPGDGGDTAACRRVLAEAEFWRRRFGIAHQAEPDVNVCGLLLAFAYPDRIAQGRGDGRFLLRNGRGAIFRGPQALMNEAYLVAAELDDAGTESRIFLAAPLGLDELRRHCGSQIETTVNVSWDEAAQAVRARKVERLGPLVLKETPQPEPDAEAVREALMFGIRTSGLDMLPWTKASSQLRQRLRFLHRLKPGWPDLSDENLLDTLPSWLGPYLYGIRSRDDLQRVNLTAALEGLLTWEQRRELEALAPTHITVPSGQSIPIDYGDLTAPALAVRLQEMFGLAETPAVAGGQVPLTLQLLSPARRPVQVTRDLASFWQTTYFEVRKELLGRYPKHYWPENPLDAVATHRVKPRK